jgi:hypothetical protein
MASPTETQTTTTTRSWNSLRQQDGEEATRRRNRQFVLKEKNLYENKRIIISESIKHFNDFTNSLNDVCARAKVLANSLQSLEDIAVPEAIGSFTFLKQPKRIFDSTGHLLEKLNSFQQ